MKNTQLLSPSQQKVKRPRPVRYDGNKKNCEDYMARDIITLYVYCGLGYSPIRHILGLENDKLIEDVVRQHMLGRTKADGSIGELPCPAKKTLSDSTKAIVNEFAARYETFNDRYIIEMVQTGTWKDDPVYKDVTCSCGAKLDPKWRLCPYCGDTSKLHK